MVKNVKNTVLWTFVILLALKGEKIVRKFYKKEMQNTNQDLRKSNMIVH